MTAVPVAHRAWIHRGWLVWLYLALFFAIAALAQSIQTAL